MVFLKFNNFLVYIAVYVEKMKKKFEKNEKKGKVR